MNLTWDADKNRSNYRKHHVWFEEAQTVLRNPLTLMAPNSHPEGNRMEYLGHSLRQRLLYVITVEANEDEVRIISARTATAHERKGYEGQRV